MSLRAVLGGVGLLSVLAAVVIVALLGSRALDGADGALRPVEEARDADATLAGGPPESADDGVVLPGRDAATVASCESSRRAIELAARAFEAATGELPGDLGALTGAGFLADPVDTHTLAVVEGQLVITGTGLCA